MKIIQIDIENNRKVKCFHKEVDGGNLEVAGETATGKTTAISALWDILEKGSDNLTHGESKGKVKVVLGDGRTTITAKRINTKKSSRVAVSKEVGGEPGDMSIKDLNAMLSKLSINPHKIAEMTPMDRVKTLLGASGADIEEMDRRIDEAVEDRKLKYRQKEDNRPGEIPDKVERIKVSDLLEKRKGVEETNSAIESRGQWRNQKKVEIANYRQQIKDMEKEIEDKKRAIESRNDVLAEEEEEYQGPDGKIPLDDIDQQIAEAEEQNQKAALYESVIRQKEHYNQLENNHLQAEETVKRLRSEKEEMLNDIEWPIDGLQVDGSDILYNGCYLPNLGESEKILVTAAIALGDIRKHPVKVVRLDGIESMSKRDYEHLKGMFNGEGVQVLSTRVTRGDVEPDEIVIEDGEYREMEDEKS